MKAEVAVKLNTLLTAHFYLFFCFFSDFWGLKVLDCKKSLISCLIRLHKSTFFKPEIARELAYTWYGFQ